MPFPPVECFWVEPTGKSLRTLRRYLRGEEPCPSEPGEYHNASVELPESFDTTWSNDSESGARYVGAIDVAEYAGDPRWPTHCACGYEFREEDHWQVNQEPIFASADGRLAWTSPAYQRKPTPGAMFEIYWRPGLRKDDGHAIAVVCPDGMVWEIDGPASSGGFWSRTGTPPKLSVTPSILTPGYHGYLTNGVLTEC